MRNHWLLKTVLLIGSIALFSHCYATDQEQDTTQSNTGSGASTQSSGSDATKNEPTFNTKTYSGEPILDEDDDEGIDD